MYQARTTSILKPISFLVASVAILIFVGNCGGSGSPTEPEAASSTVDSGTGGGSNNSSGSGSGSGGGNPGDGGTTSGKLAIQMIDDPTEEICQLWVYIRDIRVKPDQEPPILLGTGIGLYELLALQEGPPAPLGDWEVDEGTYQFIEMLLTHFLLNSSR